MIAFNNLFTRSLETSGPASMATTAVVSLCGKLEEGNSVAPINAISHILWGDRAAREDDVTLKHTAAGVALNTLAITSWAAVYELAFGRAARQGEIAKAMLGGISVAALAYVTDYYVVPRRLTPGFEKRLGSKSMLAVYATLGLTLPLASLISGYRRSRRG